MSLKVCPIASGSNGNSFFVSNGSTSILVDAGQSGKRMEAGLASIGASCAGLQAIFVTHEHSDHIMGVGVLSRRFDIPVYATKDTWYAMENHTGIGNIAGKNKRFVYQDEATQINDLSIKPFSIPHDAADPVAYSITANGKRAVIATDIGHITDDILKNITDTDVLLIESNHDEEMLRNGRYPAQLKRRVLGERGHLSNVSCGQLLSSAVTDRLRHVFLGHLSEENNRPLIAYETVSSILLSNGIKVNQTFRLHLAVRDAVSTLVEV